MGDQRRKRFEQVFSHLDEAGKRQALDLLRTLERAQWRAPVSKVNKEANLRKGRSSSV